MKIEEVLEQKLQNQATLFMKKLKISCNASEQGVIEIEYNQMQYVLECIIYQVIRIVMKDS